MKELVDNSWEWFIDKFEILSKIDLTAYKRPQMERRINSFMRSAGASDYKSFLELIKNDAPVSYTHLGLKLLFGQ